MGRAPKPTAVLDAQGTFLAHPEYKRPREPKPKRPLSTKPPKDLTAEQKVLWKELMKILPPGVAFDSDAWAARRLVMLEARARAADKLGEQLPGTESSRLKEFYIQFGLTPAARTRIQVELSEEDDLEQFLTDKLQ